VGEPRGLALDHADADTPVATGRHLFDASVVEADGRVALVLGVDLGEVGSCAQRGAQRALDDILIDHPASLRLVAGRCRTVIRVRAACPAVASTR
jgi:hypothetical protein